ncbi:MAG: hypothetical protein QE269_12210, partial [Fimbriimonas sp.]|nr:hypothetical protein [Fimbriimonas sp.]
QRNSLLPCGGPRLCVVIPKPHPLNRMHRSGTFQVQRNAPSSPMFTAHRICLEPKSTDFTHTPTHFRQPAIKLAKTGATVTALTAKH